MKILTKEIQTQHHTLGSRRDNLDMLIYDVETNKDNMNLLKIDDIEKS